MKFSVIVSITIFTAVASAQVPACFQNCAYILRQAGCGSQDISCLCSKKAELLSKGKQCMSQNNCPANSYSQVESYVNNFCKSH